MAAVQTMKGLLDSLTGYRNTIVAMLENSGLDTATQRKLTDALQAAQDAVK
jgi:predicted exporter